MKDDYIKDQIAMFKDFIIENPDNHFQEYLVMDMLEAGEVYLIDDYSWYIHWLDVLRDFSMFMDNLIQDHYNGHKEYRDYIKECVQLKQILDKKLIENPHFNLEEVEAEMRGEFYDDKEEEKQDYITIRGDKEKSEKIGELLYNLLSNKGFIDISFETFSKHFTVYSGNIEKIKWCGTEVQITALFLNLVYKGIIDRSYEYRIPSTIPKHFINKWGKEYNDRQLRVSLSRVRSGDVDHLIKEIILIVGELTKIN